MLKHLPRSVGLIIVSDCRYVVDTINFKLEYLQQQQFSDSAHPEIWRAIIAQLISQQRPITAIWTPGHTEIHDFFSAGNEHANELAQEATANEQGNLPPPPLIDEEVAVWSAIRTERPEHWEINRAIEDLNHSAAGSDNFRAEDLQKMETRPLVHKWIQCMWDSGSIPQDIAAAIMNFIGKKSGLPRPLSLSNTLYKVMANIIHNRLRVVPILPVQFGFQRARDTVSAILLLRKRIREIRKSSENGAFAIFVDFADAYSSIQHPYLWEALVRHGVPSQIISLLQSAAGAPTYPKSGESLPFVQTCGVRQGCPLSPLLFAITLDIVLRNTGIPQTAIIAYADDIVLCGRSISEVTLYINKLNEEAGHAGLSLNVGRGKTEAMWFPSDNDAARIKAHKKSMHKGLGALAASSSSLTAHTENGVRFWFNSMATHLYCPICPYIQETVSIPPQAANLLTAHFHREHKDCTIHGYPPNIRPLFPLRPIPQRGVEDIPRELIPITMPDRSVIHLPWTTQYKYLGSVVTGGQEQTVQARIYAAQASYHAMSPIWTSNHLSPWTKLDILHCVVVPSLIYGLETMVLEQPSTKRLQRCFDSWVREIMQLHSWTSPWKTQILFTTEEIRRYSWTEDISRQIARARLRLAGRVARAHKNHPLQDLWRNQEGDEWFTQLRLDAASFGISLEELKDKYTTATKLHRDNAFTPHASKADHYNNTLRRETSESIKKTTPRQPIPQQTLPLPLTMQMPQPQQLQLQPQRQTLQTQKPAPQQSHTHPQPQPQPAQPQGLVQDEVQRTVWVQAQRAEFMDAHHTIRYMRALGWVLGSCDLAYDARREKKIGLERHRVFNPYAAGIFVICDQILAVDLDAWTPTVEHFLRVLNGRCNMVSLTRNGAHLIFQAHERIRMNSADTYNKLDIRTGSGGIILVEPSRYERQGQIFRYRWICVPQNNTPLLPLPPECVALLTEHIGMTLK
jgi:hypothetical protein